MSDFDDSLDVLIAHVGTVAAEKKSMPISVDIKSYNKGAPKIRLTRAGEKKDGTSYTTKLGSVDAREARALAPLLEAAAKALDEAGA